LTFSKDTAGQEKFHALGPIYYRDADGISSCSSLIHPHDYFVAALLVYDVTDAQSFTKVKNWVKELRQMVGPDIIVAIAGNKSDLEKSRQVDPAEATAYALDGSFVVLGHYILCFIHHSHVISFT